MPLTGLQAPHHPTPLAKPIPHAANCNDGEYYDSGVQTCKLCSGGEVNPAGSWSPCTNCTALGPGYVPNANKTACECDTAGYTLGATPATCVCAAGYRRDATNTCIPCDADYFRPGNASEAACQQCPILGDGTSEPGSAVCTCNQPGFVWDAAANTCAKCQPGKYRAGGDPQACEACPMFAWSTEGSGTCDCQNAGYIWDAATRDCTACNRNEFRPQGDPQVCSKCPNEGRGDVATSDPGSGGCICTMPGQYWSENTRKCELCAQGEQRC